MGDRLVGVFIVFLGVDFLLDNLGLPSVDLHDVVKLWPLALVWVGWKMLRSSGPRHDQGDPA